MTLDLTGQRFGKLIATECLGSIKSKRYWAVKCDCGNENLVRASFLKEGKVQSCGCSRKDNDQVVEMSRLNIKHGGRLNGKTSPEYAAWLNLRIEAKQDFVSEWNAFQQFFKDIGWKPSPEHRLKRRDIRKPHGPENTYWKDPNEIQPTHADLGEEFFLDMRGAFSRSAKTTEERETAAQCVLR